MQVGRELDALIAEKIFKQTVVKNKKGGWSIGEADFYDEGGFLNLANPLPLYSEFIEDAWEIIKVIEGEITICCSKDGWSVVFKNGQSLENTVEHAICLAALRTKGVLI